MTRIILSHSDHPLYVKLKGMTNFCEYDDFTGAKDGMVFDFTLLNDDKKNALLSKISCEVISDFSVNNGDAILGTNRKIIGTVAAAFASPMNKCEYSGDNRTSDFLKEIGLTGVKVNSPGFGFIYPRVISMIINEAFYSLEDELAEKKDIDTAMKFGVNYPLGPFEWVDMIGVRPVIMLLDQLYETTNDKRYMVSQKLKEELS